MTFLRCIAVCAPLALILVTISFLSATSPADRENRSVVPIGFAPQGTATPEVAATSLFRACVTKSPSLFNQVLLLGVCDGPVNTLNKYAECLHKTTFTNGKIASVVFDLPRPIREQTAKAVASQDFDPEDKDVAALQFQLMSTYYAEKFMCVEVAADGDDDLEYRSRFVVAMVKDRWYAIPRCGSSISFYQIADSMHLTPLESMNVN